MISRLKKAIFVGVSRSYKFFEKFLGLHVTYPHFYSPLPTLSELDPNQFSTLFNCKGLDFQGELQKQRLQEFLKFSEEYSPSENIGLSLVDAFVLYSMIRSEKPQKMIEIGSGQSTLIALKALTKNLEEGHEFSFTAIEPFPPAHLHKIQDSRFKLIVSKVQEVQVEVFQDADLLFIDSSHVSKIGSDVNYELLEIVPSLKAGCAIHWHDIFFPQEYPKSWIESGQQFWNESYMLQAFLAYNSDFKIQWASKYLQTFENVLLKSSFPYYTDKHNLSSIWVKRINY